VLSYAERDLLESAWSWVRSPLFAEGYRNRGEKENSSSFLTDITTCSLGVALLPPSSTAATAVAGHGTVSLSGEGVGNRERESSLTVTTSASPSVPVTVTAAGLLLSWIQQHDGTHPNFKVNSPLTLYDTLLYPHHTYTVIICSLCIGLDISATSRNKKLF
jgi:hypothetical protein